MVTQVVIVDDGVVDVVYVPEVSVITTVTNTATVITEGIQGPPGPIGPQGPAAAQSTHPAGTTLDAYQAVYLDNAGTLQIATNSTSSHAFALLGLAQTAAVATQQIVVHNIGEIENALWTWTLGQPIYLGTLGLLTQTPPVAPGSAFSMVVGWPISTTRIYFAKREPVALA